MITITRTLEFDAGNYRILNINNTMYAVFDDGRVWSFYFRKFTIPDIDRDGYRIVTVGRRKVKLHRLVLCAFTGEMKNLQVRHLDGNPANNNLSNLAWGTAQENWSDRIKHRRGIGEEHGSVKLTADQVLKIREHVKTRTVLKDLAKTYNVSCALISKIRSKQVWKHL